MIDVLLVSPRLPSTHPRYGGDNAYTDLLLQYPPEGVRYHHYEDLMTTGQVRKLKWLYRIGPRLVRYGILPPDLWAEYLVSDFVPDVLHIYGFSAVVRFPCTRAPVPVVMGMSTGSYSDLRFYVGWEDAQVRRARRMKRLYLRLIGAYDSSLHPEKACRVHVWSQFSRQMHLEEGYVRPEQIEVLYPGLPLAGRVRKEKDPSEKVSFLFVGRDFVRKNGALMLQAFRQARERCPQAELILVSQLPDGRRLAEEGVVHYPFLTRQELYERIYPRADVLVLPSKSEGFGLVLVEAMSFGLPVIAVDAWAMPEIVQDGVNGYLIPPGSLEELVTCMTRVARDREHLDALARGARRVFQERFALPIHNRRLRQVYEESLSSSGR